MLEVANAKHLLAVLTKRSKTAAKWRYFVAETKRGISFPTRYLDRQLCTVLSFRKHLKNFSINVSSNHFNFVVSAICLAPM